MDIALAALQFDKQPENLCKHVQSLSTGVNADKSASCIDYISNYGHEKKKFTPQLNCSKVWKSIGIQFEGSLSFQFFANFP